jgi:cytochrome c553
MNSSTSLIILVGAIFFSHLAMAMSDPTTELNQLDKRTPVPLLPHMALHQKQNMREHLESVQGIIAGLSRDDYKAVAQYAAQMGFTPEMGQMCEHMGAGAEGFSEKAIHFHKTADTIVQAAKKRDRNGVMKALNSTLTQCTSCHATYRQQVMDEATYNAFMGKMKSH